MDEKALEHVGVNEGSIKEGTTSCEYDRYVFLHSKFEGAGHKQLLRKRQ